MYISELKRAYSKALRDYNDPLCEIATITSRRWLNTTHSAIKTTVSLSSSYNYATIASFLYRLAQWRNRLFNIHRYVDENTRELKTGESRNLSED